MANNTVSFSARLQDFVSGKLKGIGKTGKRTFSGLNDNVDKFQRNVKSSGSSVSSLGSTLKKVAIGVGAAFAVQKVVQFGTEIFKTTAEFEKMQAVLNNTLGKEDGEAAFKNLEKFASNTNFSLQELTGSYLKFVNRGIKPANTELMALADIANSQGKSFDQLTEAVLDAGTGEFERLKDFGIKASKAGDKVSFTFKGQTKTVQNSEQAIQDYLYSLGQLPGVAGATDKISNTLEGRLSNLGDKFNKLKYNLGKDLLPAFTDIIGVASDFLGQLSETGVLKTFGTFLADNIGKTIKFISDSFKFVFNNLSNIKDVFAPIKTAISPIIDAFTTLKGEMGLTNDAGSILKTTFNVIGNIIEFLSPALKTVGSLIGSLITGFGKIGFAIKSFFKENQTITKFITGLATAFVGLFKSIAENASNVFGGFTNVITSALSLDPSGVWKGIKEMVGSVFSGYGNIAKNIKKDFKSGYESGFSTKDFFKQQDPKKGKVSEEEASTSTNTTNTNTTNSGKDPSAGLTTTGSSSTSSSAKAKVINFNGNIIGVNNMNASNLEDVKDKLRAQMEELMINLLGDVDGSFN